MAHKILKHIRADGELLHGKNLKLSRDLVKAGFFAQAYYPKGGLGTHLILLFHKDLPHNENHSAGYVLYVESHDGKRIGVDLSDSVGGAWPAKYRDDAMLDEELRNLVRAYEKKVAPWGVKVREQRAAKHKTLLRRLGA